MLGSRLRYGMFAARTAVPLCRIWQRGAGSCTQHFKGSREVAIVYEIFRGSSWCDRPARLPSNTFRWQLEREVAIRAISTVKLRTEIRERPPQTKISGGSAPQTPPARSLRSLALVFFFFFKFSLFTFTFFRSTTLEKTPSFFLLLVFLFCFPFV